MKRPQDKLLPWISLASLSNKIGGEEIPEGLIEPYRREGAVDPNAAGAFWFNEKALAEVWRNYHFPDRSVMETPNGTNHFILVPSNEIGEWGSKSWELVSPPNNPRMGFRKDHFRLAPYRTRPMDATIKGDRDMSWNHETIDKAMYRLTRLAGCAKGDTGCDPTKDMSPEDKAKWEAENEAHRDQFKEKASRRSGKLSRRASRGYPSGLNVYEMRLWDKLLLVAENDSRAFHKGDPAGAVMSAFTGYRRDQVDKLDYGFKKIKKALISAVTEEWTAE